jgi:hypothetical protein
MKYLNCPVLSASDTASQTSAAIDSQQLMGASFHIYFGDNTVAGSVKLQASNDICATNYSAQYNFVPTNWVDIPSASVSIVAGAPELITLPNTSTMYRFMRVVYTFSSGGSSTINVNMFAMSM